jgi:hypothetical protein
MMRPLGNVVARQMLLDPPQWDDLRVPASATTIGAANQPAFQKNMDNGAGSVGLFQRTFAAGARNDVFAEFQIPHQRKIGSDMGLHFHWVPTTNHNGNVLWECELAIANIDAAFPVTGTTVFQVTTLNAGARLNQNTHTELMTVIGSGITLSAFLLMRLSRLGGDGADTYTGEGIFLGIDLHYQIDTLGSQTEVTKFF